MLSDSAISWLLESDPRTAYMTRKDLLNETLSAEERQAYISGIKSDAHVAKLINDVSDYFPMTATRHTDAKLSHYKLRMLSDFGLKKDDGLHEIVDNAKQRLDNGLLAIRQSLPFPDAGKAVEWHALPCDNPVLTYTLKTLGEDDALLKRQLEHLKEKWATPLGWFCDFPFVKSQFKKEQKGCPMAGLQALEAFSTDEDLKESVYAQNAFRTIADHYELGRSIYYFGRGKNFFTFKYPFVWYNALYMADVLSRFDFAKEHPVMLQLISWIEKGRAEGGRYKPTSIYMEYKDWDFGNKKEFSPWITFLCHRILKRFA